MKNLKLFFIVAALSTLAFVGCKKGDTGPAGPKGPAGPDSVMYSAWTTLSTSIINIDNSVTPADTTYGENISASGLTSSILNSGIILSYIGVPGGAPNGTDTLVLNISDVYTYTTGGFITQDLYPGTIDLYSNFDLTGLLYRYVLISGTILTNGYNGKAYTKQELSTMTYSQIKQTFGTSSKSTTN
ncbi:MAG: hypothetical protein JST87_02090 [Bacteroidetes bacterium]|nr:hypothetical protein [Bacteroidota bacterium]